MIHREPREEALVLRIEHGKANTIDVELLSALSEALREARHDTQGSVVITGTGPFFSAGVDLFRIVNEGPPYLDRFLPLLGDVLLELFTFERPVVAAVNGHAIAGGCLVACACDYRVMSGSVGRIGVPELLVGVPMPLVPLEVLRAALAPDDLRYLLITGRTVSADEAVRRGIVDEHVPDEDVLPRACAVAATLGAVPPASFAHTKRALRRPALERIAAQRDADDRALAPLWAAPATLDFIRDYVQKTIGRSR